MRLEPEEVQVGEIVHCLCTEPVLVRIHGVLGSSTIREC